MTKKNKVINETEELLKEINKAIIDKKGTDLVNLNLESIENAIAKYFVICHGTSDVHVKTIADSIEVSVKQQLGERPLSVEGIENSQWVLLDYFNIVVHVFQKDYRDFYKLEELWGDAEFSKIS